MDSQSVREEVGQKIKSVREARKLTQAEVAKKAGIHVNYFARVERGEVNPSIEILQNIIKALNAKSSDILPF